MNNPEVAKVQLWALCVSMRRVIAVPVSYRNKICRPEREADALALANATDIIAVVDTPPSPEVRRELYEAWNRAKTAMWLANHTVAVTLRKELR